MTSVSLETLAPRDFALTLPSRSRASPCASFYRYSFLHPYSFSTHLPSFALGLHSRRHSDHVEQCPSYFDESELGVADD